MPACIILFFVDLRQLYGGSGGAECTTLRLERLRLGRYGLAHLRLLQSRLGRLRLELTHVPFRLVPDKSMTAGVMIMLYVSLCRCSCQTFNFARKFGDISILK